MLKPEAPRALAPVCEAHAFLDESEASAVVADLMKVTELALSMTPDRTGQ